jgi:putative hydrolase of the HAD superfamily
VPEHPIDAILLDVGGVFLLPDPVPICAQLGATLGRVIEPGEVERAHYAGVRALDLGGDENDYLDAYARAFSPRPEQLDPLLAALRQAWGTPGLWCHAVRASVEGLHTLAETGRKLGIVSNADGTVEELLRAQSICQIGEGLGVPVLAIVDSTVVGMAKPDPAIFAHALERLGGLEPRRAVYVGDSLRYDVLGARAAGLQPIHFDPYRCCPRPADHPHVRRLADVAGLIQ